MKKMVSFIMSLVFVLSAASFTAFAAETSPSDVTAALASVDNADTVSNTLTIMWQGMLGIFVVMLLIYLTVVILNACSKNKKDK